MKRNFPGSAVAMLTAAAVITDNALADIDFLLTKRPLWKSPYFDNLKTKIDSGFVAVGIDKASEMRQATSAVLAVQQQALTGLAELKIQITEDFKSEKTRKTEILNTLGFTSFYASAARRNQTTLVKLLNQFKENLTTELKAEIEAKGTAPESLDKIVALADELKAANVSQEVHKGSKKSLTDSDIELLNNIYDEAISVAKIAHSLYKGNAAKQNQYSFTKILNRLTAGGAKTVAKTVA
jgi:hypothetical protein